MGKDKQKKQHKDQQNLHTQQDISEENNDKEQKNNKEALNITFSMILVVIISFIAVYMHHTTESVIEETLLLILVVFLLIMVWRRVEAENMGIESFPEKKKKEKKSNGKEHGKTDKSVVNRMPRGRRRKNVSGNIPNFNIATADKRSPEERIPEELLKSIESDFYGKRVLLAEDNETNREIETYILAQIGFEVETAEDGKQAVDMIKKSKTGYYDVIVMDIMMPVMDGYEAARAIRGLSNQKLAEIPIVALTSKTSDKDIDDAKEAGMNGHIAKPIDVLKMTKVLEKVLYD